MKKTFFILSVLTLVFLSACSKKNDDSKKIPVAAPSTSKNLPDINIDKIDYDLTQMSSTMIYAQVFNMLIEPEYFLDKVIKVNGNFQVFQNDETGELFFAILIPDATQCCQQGIEFIWQGNHKFPDDYPEIGQDITITGVYCMQEDSQGVTYTYLSLPENSKL